MRKIILICLFVFGCHKETETDDYISDVYRFDTLEFFTTDTSLVMQNWHRGLGEQFNLKFDTLVYVPSTTEKLKLVITFTVESYTDTLERPILY